MSPATARLRARIEVMASSLPPLGGDRVAEFALPLELCPTLNTFAEWPAWRRKRTKLNALAVMLGQHGRRASAPLPGKPVVRAVRYSSREPDRDSAWTKVPLDRLCVAHGGVGLLRDDRPSAVDVEALWRAAPRGHGGVWVEVWSTEPDQGSSTPSKSRRSTEVT